MLRVILTRAVLVALPFVVWFAWAYWSRRAGRPMGATPWAWLFAVGALLVGVSLLGGRLLQDDRSAGVYQEGHKSGVYVPGETQPDGTVSKGHFEK